MQKKKKPARRTGASKKRKPRSSSTSVKIAGQNFTKSSCHITKSDAKKRAEGIRTKGTRARVIKNGKAYCVYTGGKSKRKLVKRRA